MKRKKIYLKYKKERAILSDVLPYETPITFSNRHFYDFLLAHKIHYADGNILWEKDDEALEAIVKILFGADLCCMVETSQKPYLDKSINISQFKNRKDLSFISIPFSYKISHKKNEHRDLAICHPRNQLQLIDLYQEFKESILYCCSLSPFSIRRPSKIAKFIYHKDKAHYQRLSREDVVIEEFTREYENLKSFFSYRDYSNVHKFYESYKYHRCEQKYDAMVKLDISKCFDSIYTHSLGWALIGKEVVKENLRNGKLKGTFADRFDRFMQDLNYSETNGIIIGPEFSRIFAELILQYIDGELAVRLESKYRLLNKTNYEMFRYVDDYFIFYNDVSEKDNIQQELQVLLREFKLSLNSAKVEIYEKPIITGITIAKLKIAELLSESLAYHFESGIADEGESSGDEGEAQSNPQMGFKKGSIYINSNKLITKFKTIIKESQVEYKDLQNYSLSVVERKNSKIIQDYYKLNPDEKEKNEKQVVRAIINILDFSFFIYSVSPRVNTTIKLCRIIKTCTDFLKRDHANIDLRHLVFKIIYDKTLFILKKNKNGEYTQVETLYLLVALSELGRQYWLEEDILCGYFGINKAERVTEFPLNYFSLTVLLFYIRNKKRYNWLRSFIEEELCKKFDKKSSFLKKSAELTLLLFDVLACPYVQLDTKKTLLEKYGITASSLQESVIGKRKHWFTKWSNFDLAKELDAKKSSEVY